jgi:hypothetical protein
MGVTLDDRAAGLQRHVVERVRQLTQPATDRRDHAALLQHATGDIASGARGTADLPPEAEGLAPADQHAVQRSGGAAQILDLAQLQRSLLRQTFRPQRRTRLAGQRGEAVGGSLAQPGRAGLPIDQQTLGAMRRHLGAKQQCLCPRRHGLVGRRRVGFGGGQTHGGPSAPL